MKKLVIGIVAVTLFAAGCSSPSAKPTPTPTAVAQSEQPTGASAQGYVTPIRHADLAFRTGGRVAEVLVKEGDVVRASQPLVKLQDVELQAALMQAQANLKSLQNGARSEEIASAQAAVDVAKSQLDLAAADLARLQNGALAVQLASAQADAARATADLKVAQDSYDALVLGPGHGIATDMNNPSRGLGAYEEQKRAQLEALKAANDAAQKRLTEARVSVGDDLQSAQAGVDSAKAQLDAAQARLDLLKAGATTEDIQAAKAGVDQAQAAVDEAALVAPFDGTVAQVNINAGEIAAPGVPIASIADVSQWQVETDDLSEVDVVGIQPGAEASITVDALPGVTLEGQVTGVTPRSEVKRGDVTYTVKVVVTDPDPRLKWGMTAFVDIRK
jgi:HlyD family secretion protein